MAEKTFGETLTKILNQRSILGNRDERAVEIAVILPLLHQVGWDTGKMDEIYPQSPVDSGGKVDYALQVGGEVRILVEAKRWNSPLEKDEENQLTGYCRQAKPNLAALTNGNRWKLYLPPKGRKNDAKLRLFLDFYLTSLDQLKVQGNFEQFLAKDRFKTKTSSAQVVKEAETLLAKLQDAEAAFQNMTAAWNSLTDDPQPLLAFIEGITDPHPHEEQVEQFLKSVGVSSLVHQVTTVTPPPPPPKPRSFTFQGGDETPVKSRWSNLLVGVCLLMHEHDPDKLRATLLARPEWFTESKPVSGNWPKAIGDTGIYAHFGDGNAVKHRCAVLLGEFGYPASDLTIKFNNGAEIPLNPP